MSAYGPVDWPPPRDDGGVEHGENVEHHLLPPLDRVRAMTPAQRARVLDAIADWVGDAVDDYRRRVRAL